MKFDFYLPDYKTAIECDGAQHFRSVNSEWNSETKLQETRARDLAKQKYCKEHGIKLIQIPFWDHKALSVKNLKEILNV
jgi:very-short-patch-repair endonuclease